MELQIFLVEDSPDDLKQLLIDLPSEFKRRNIAAKIHECSDFKEALTIASDPKTRFDMIISDTYRGDTKLRDAAVLAMVSGYREHRFCPLVIYSSGVQPAEFTESPFALWADKSTRGSIERAVGELLDSGVPQIARMLHEELDQLGSDYLWTFLDKHWDRLKAAEFTAPNTIERLVRRRASIQLAHLAAGKDKTVPIKEVHSLDYYLYPPIDQNSYSLGEVVRSIDTPSDVRVILTPHCHLTLQEGQDKPRAEHVLTVRTRTAGDVLGKDKLQNAKSEKTEKKLRSWATPPSGENVGKPEGRFWFLPGFLEIPHSFCDFLLIESIPHEKLKKEFESLAVLSSPFAESLQTCFTSYHSAVGIPNLNPTSIVSMLEDEKPDEKPDESGAEKSG